MFGSVEEALDKLGRSRFRRRFRLSGPDAEYARSRGLAVLMEHAGEFVDSRLAGARPRNDGRQTPMRGHPVFVAQHATGTCCRGCLARWHGIAAGRALTTEERAYVLGVIEGWLGRRPSGEKIESRQERVEADAGRAPFGRECPDVPRRAAGTVNGIGTPDTGPGL